MDLTAICVFRSKNPILTLLAYTLYTIHSRHGKGGNVGLCHSMLYQWFKVHLPVSGSFLDTRHSLQWSSRLVNLTSFDIQWNYVMGEVRSIITSCRYFPNVPLMGTKGCIKYNHALAYRQLGYAMDGPPKDGEVFESVYFVRGSDPEMLKRMTSAWKGIHKKDRTTLGKKVHISRVPYMEWIKDRLRFYGYHLQGRLLHVRNLLLF